MGPYAERMTINLMRQASNAVAYMHDMNVIHRDIKPENALVCFSKAMLTLIDMGGATCEPAPRSVKMVRGSSIVGSSFYTAPEVYMPELRSVDGQYSEAVDMWSIGVMLYVCWTASEPVSDSWQADGAHASGHFFFDEEEWLTPYGNAIALVVRGMCIPQSSSRMTAQEADRALQMLLGS